MKSLGPTNKTEHFEKKDKVWSPEGDESKEFVSNSKRGLVTSRSDTSQSVGLPSSSAILSFRV